MTIEGSETADKQPVLLVVYIETAAQRWYLLAVDDDASAVPLVRSQPGSLAGRTDRPFDERLSFLRHRLAGVIQRGCDRLWGRRMKASRIVFISDGDFPEADTELTDRLAQHFDSWLANPPIVFFRTAAATDPEPPSERAVIAGDIPADDLEALQTAFSKLRDALEADEPWETVEQPPDGRP